MAGKSVLIMLDQATRDGVSQLLVAHYLRRKGVTVHIGNQSTVIALFERHKPDVFFASWTTNPPTVDYLHGIRHRTQLLLVDQEGGRMGEASFKRSVQWQDGAKLKLARSAARVVTWGTSQARWLMELGIPREKIVVTGCPRLDPYLLDVKERRGRTPFVGVTLRADPLTALPRRMMETAYESNFKKDGLAPSLPVKAQCEDWFWRIIAETRHMFLAITELAKKTRAPIVVRPGPWEQYHVYDFLQRNHPNVTVDPFMVQHRYVGDAFTVIDASSALGLESLLAGTPVISIVSLVPGLEEHVGGKDGARLNSPYRGFYWQPSSIEGLVDYALRAERGELALTPDPEGMKKYLWDCHGWPPKKPASFQTGDAILELLGLPSSSRLPPYDGTLMEYPACKRTIYSRLPGSQAIPHLKLYWKCLFSEQGYALRRYHYLPVFYRHHAEVRGLFEELCRRFP